MATYVLLALHPLLIQSLSIVRLLLWLCGLWFVGLWCKKMSYKLGNFPVPLHIPLYALNMQLNLPLSSQAIT